MALFLRPFLSNTTPSSALSPQVLRDWLQAIEAFQAGFHELDQVRLYGPTNELKGSGLYAQVNQLLERMGQELTVLLHDLTNSAEPVNLVSHTARLRLLTNQATILLALLNLSKG